MSDLSGRLFVAAAIPEPVREALAEALRSALPRGLPGRAVRPESWHFTLRFLGDTSHAEAAALLRELEAAELGPPLELSLGGAGAFPRPERARVIWLGVDRGADALRRLAAAVEAAARRAGFPAERRPFAPHLTLSRLRDPAPVGPLLASLPRPALSLPVGEVVLYRSHLGGGPASYEPLRRISL